MNSTEPQTHYPPHYKSVFSVWIGALILCSPAFLNNFPFLYADTGTYLIGGFHGDVSEIRPIAYGLFIRHVSLFESLWLVIFVQAIIVSWLVHVFYRTFTAKLNSYLPLISIFILTLATGLGEITGMLMPDFLTPVMILSGAILIMGHHQKWWQVVLLGVLFWFSMAAHHSNAYTFFCVVAYLIIAYLLNYSRKKTGHLSSRRLIAVAGLILIGYFTIPFLHLAYGGEFYWSKSKNVILTNRINQMGLLVPFLKKNCQSHNYRLCGSIDEIPFDLLWGEDSPMRKSGGMAANDPDYGILVNDFFHEPYFVKKFFIKTLENGIIQFFTFEGLIIIEEKTWGYPYNVIEEVWPEQIPAYRRSLQFSNLWKLQPTQHLQRFLVYGSMLYLLWIFCFAKQQHYTPVQKQLMVFILLALIFNAFICAGISMVDMRFQYRVIWLIPFFAIMIFSDHLSKISWKGIGIFDKI